MSNDSSLPKGIEQLQQLRELLDRVLDAPENAREAILSECADAWIREQVRQVIEPTLKAERQSDEIWPKCQSRFGPYRVLATLGHGGMGTVFLAERDDGNFKQQVAIKVIRHAMGDTTLVHRFQRERQILAGLQHPNIARMYDGGVFQENPAQPEPLPWYAMEYVPGDRLDQLIAQNRLSTRDSVRLMIKLANAVQYAHQNLIVHRDLKPQNIMVDAQLEPKLLDFGVATMLSESDSAQTISRAPMTLAYAAPEQIRGEAMTAATDLYSLGVILFELLTGERPHKVRAGDPAGISLLQAITETDAPAPSAVLKHRISTQPIRHQAELRGDLDTIILKALNREPVRRYPTAQAFAEDLQNWLDQRPIRARPNSWWYRTSKWTRRNPIATGLAAILVISLTALGTMLVHQRNAAIRQAQRADATKNFVINSFTQANRWVSGREVTARELALQGLDAVASELANQPEARIEMYGVLARTLARTDALRDAAKAQALELSEMHKLGSYDAATLAHRKLLLAQHYWWAEDIPAALAELEKVDADPALPAAHRYSTNMLRSVIAAMQGDTTAVTRYWPDVPNEQLVALAETLPPDQRFKPETVPPYRAAYQLQLHVLHLQRHDALLQAERLVQYADYWLPKRDVNRGAFMMYVGSAVASFADTPPANALTDRAQNWLVRQFGVQNEFAQDVPIAKLSAQYRAGRFTDAETAYQRIHEQYMYQVQRTNLDCRDIERLGGLIAIAQGAYDIARQRLTDAIHCARALDIPSWETPHTKEVAAALAYLDWLQGDATGLSRLQNIAASQAARNDGGWWQSAIWLADHDWQSGERKAAKTQITTLVSWFHDRGWPYPEVLRALSQRMHVTMPAQAEPDLRRILKTSDTLLTDAEQTQALRQQ